MSCFTKKPKYFTAKRQSSLPFPLPYSDTENLFPHTAEHGCPVPAAPPERMLRCAAPQTRSVLQPTLRCPHALVGAGKRQRVKHTASLTHTANRGYRQPYAHCVTGHMGHTGRTASPTAGTHPAPHPALRSPAQGSPRPAPLTGSPRAQLPAAGLGAAGLRRALGVGVGQPGGLGLPRPALVVARLDGVGPAAPAAHRGRRSQPPPRHHRVAPSPRRGTAPGSVRTRPRSRHGPLSLLVSHSLTLSAPSPPGVLSPLLPPLSTPSAGLPPSLRCPLPSLKSPSQSPSPLPPPFPPPRLPRYTLPCPRAPSWAGRFLQSEHGAAVLLARFCRSLYVPVLHTSQNHRITVVGKNRWGSLSQTPRYSCSLQQSHRKTSRWALSIFEERKSRASVCILCQCSVTLSAMKIFLVFVWNFPSCGVCPFPLVLCI